MEPNERKGTAAVAEAVGVFQGLSRVRVVIIMAGLLLGMLLAALDQTVVSTAMPRIVTDLGGLSQIAWVFTIYMLTSTTLMPIAGKLSDIYGRKALYLAGLAVFMVGSVLSGVAQNMLQLIVFRSVQGAGAAFMMSNSMAAVGDLIPPVERGKWQGLFAAVFGLASIIGPLVGGYLTDNLSWRWIFYINLPVGFLAAAILVVAMPTARVSDARPKIDYLGAAVMLLAFLPMLLAFSLAGQGHPWLSGQVTGLLIFSVIMVGFFLLVERKAEDPILPLWLFKSSIFNVTSLGGLLMGMGMFGAIVFIPLFIQGVIGKTATSSGMVVMPMSVGMMVGSILTGQLISRTGRYRLSAVVSAGVMTFGMFLLTRMNVHTTQAVAIRNMVILGFGLGAIFPLLILVVQNAFPHRVIGVVTATSQFFRGIGGTIGVAVMGTLLATRLASEMTTAVPAEVTSALPPQLASRITDPDVLVNQQAVAQIGQQIAQEVPGGQAIVDQLFSAMRGALAVSIHDVFVVGTGIMALSFVAFLFLKEIPLRKTNLPAAGAEPAREQQAGARAEL